MKVVTESFKIDIKTYGRQFDIKLKINNTDFNADNLNSIKPSFTTSLFKTLMHQIELDSKVYMPKGTKLSGKIGVKVNEKNYEYIDLNTYYVETCERQEDMNSYRIIAYTKIKDSMIDYDLTIADKITVRNYLIKICERLGWDTKNIPATFINSEKLVNPVLHTGIDYTFRDALDEIATITCSFLMFKNDEFYLIYLTDTNETIDESYLDEDNVTIGEKYLINALVFSRAEESDNIYRKDDNNIELNGLHEYRISDCQLLSTNDRADYIDEMFEYLKTLEFYIFDIQSKGILFLEACDLFNLKLNNVNYKVVLLNNEINIDDGLTESMYLDKPEETKTEYKYADETDKKINQTYILVDKQNKKIQQVVAEQSEQNQKLSQVTQTVDELNSKIQDIADITTFGESMYAKVELDSINESEPIQIIVKPTVENISYLYPHNNLYPSDTLYPKVRTIRFTNKSLGENEEGKYIDFIFPDDLLIAPDGTCDEFYLGYDEQICQVTKRCKYNEDGTVSKLDTEQIISYNYPNIQLKDGDYTIELLGYTNAYLAIRLMAQNIYTTQFATKAEVNSEISQKADEITSTVSATYETKENAQTQYTQIKQTTNNISSEVNKKVDETELGTKISQNYKSVQIAWNTIEELIQFIEGKLKILNQNKENLMTLDKTGQHFFSNNEEFGNMGVNVVDEQKYISFSINGEYGSTTQDGMAWGITTKSDGKFFPILFIKNFSVANKESDDYYGQLVLATCDLVLQGMQTGIISGNVKMYGNDLTSGMVFEDTSTGTVLLEIIPEGSALYTYQRIKLLDGAIDFFKNQSGSYSLKIGTSVLTDEDVLIVGSKNNQGSFSVYGYSNFYKGITVDGNVYADNISSDRRIKDNIKDSTKNAIDLIMKIKHRQYDKKTDDRHYDIGYIAQELEEIEPNFVIKREKTENFEERYYINELPIIATLTKAIQEQQEQIEQLQIQLNELKGVK